LKTRTTNDNTVCAIESCCGYQTIFSVSMRISPAPEKY